MRLSEFISGAPIWLFMANGAMVTAETILFVILLYRFLPVLVRLK